MTKSFTTLTIGRTTLAVLPRIGVTYQAAATIYLLCELEPQFQPNARGAVHARGASHSNPKHGHQYEVGVRTSELHGRLSSSLAFYRIRASNLLITNPGNPLASIQIGTTESKGIEVDTSGRIRSGMGHNLCLRL